jgi:LysM repeat protein
MKKYVVREGDTMWSIAEANGIRPKLLMASNPQVRNPNQLKPGTVIIIPELTKGTGHGKGTIGSVHPQATPVAPSDALGAGGTMSTGKATGAMAVPGASGHGTVGHGAAGHGAAGHGMEYATGSTAPGVSSTDPASGPAGTDMYDPMHTGSQPGAAMPAEPGATGTVPPAQPGASSKMPPFFGFVWPHAVQPGETWYTIQQKYKVQMQHLLQMNPGLANRPLRPGDLLYVPGMVPSSQLPSWASHAPVHSAHTGSVKTGGMSPAQQQPHHMGPGGAMPYPAPSAAPDEAHGPAAGAQADTTHQPPYAPGQAYDPMQQPPYAPGQAYDPMQPPPYAPGQAYHSMQPPYAPGQAYDPMQPPYAPGQAPDPTQPPYAPGQGYAPAGPGYASQWTEPYGPHQHNPFRWDGEMYSADTWEDSSDWGGGDPDGNGDWRGKDFAAAAEKYYKFAVPQNPTSEISVYLGEENGGPEPES